MVGTNFIVMRSKKNINKYIYKKKVHDIMYLKFGKKQMAVMVKNADDAC